MAIMWDMYGKGASDAADGVASFASGMGFGTAARKRAELQDLLGKSDLTTPEGAAGAAQGLLAKGFMKEGQTLLDLAVQSKREAAQMGLKREEITRNQQNMDRTFGFQQQEAARAQKNQDNTFGLQKQIATEKEGPKIVWEDDGSGVKKPFVVQGANVKPADMPQGNSPAIGNPFGGGKFNADQGKAAGFSDRMLQSEGILSGINGSGGVGIKPPSHWNNIASQVPIVGNSMVSGDFQKYDQARRDFVNAQLRRESGAAISSSEFDSAEKQYFPTPGDTPEVIKQKASNRRAAIEAMGREGGGAYKPRYVFDEGGRVVPYRGAPPASGAGNNSGKNILGKAPPGVQDGMTGTHPNGQKFVVRNGMVEAMQ